MGLVHRTVCFNPQLVKEIEDIHNNTIYSKKPKKLAQIGLESGSSQLGVQSKGSCLKEYESICILVLPHFIPFISDDSLFNKLTRAESGVVPKWRELKFKLIIIYCPYCYNKTFSSGNRNWPPVHIKINFSHWLSTLQSTTGRRKNFLKCKQ